MFDHIGLKVSDVAASARFFAAALEPLGLVQAPLTRRVRVSGRRMRPRYGSAGDEPGTAFTSPSPAGHARRSKHFTRVASPRAVGTMARRAYAPIMDQRTSPRF
jgi:catechol 2,3-dioxygenase-like lactoylglutathione lyase family enzyme